MKILFIGDYSNYHVTLATALRRMGHECTVVSSGSRCMQTSRDIDLYRKPGLKGGLDYALKMHKLMPQLSGFDVVQLINPNFLELRPQLIYHFFNKLKQRNGKICMSVCGSDPVIINDLAHGYSLRYSEFVVDGHPTQYASSQNLYGKHSWLSQPMVEHCHKIYEQVDCAISSLYEYQIISEKVLGGKLHYLGIPIDIDSLPLIPSGQSEKLNLFVGIKSECEDLKGTGLLLEVAHRLQQEYPDICTVTEARDLPYSEYITKLHKADIVLDQIYSYTPATNALEAMAMGKVAVSGAEPEYYDFIGEHELQPIVNVLPNKDDIYAKLKQLVLNRDIVKEKAEQGRKFVQRHNSASTLATQYIDIVS